MQFPNYITVGRSSLGEPNSFHPAALRYLWEQSERCVRPEVDNGILLISGHDDWMPGRAMIWANLQVDVLYLYTGEKEMKDVEVTFQASIAQPGPSEATTYLEQQVEAITDMTPVWVPLDDQSYAKRREEMQQETVRHDEQERKRKAAEEAKKTKAEHAAARAAEKETKKRAAAEERKETPKRPRKNKKKKTVVRSSESDSDSSATATGPVDTPPRDPERTRSPRRSPPTPRDMPPPAPASSQPASSRRAESSAERSASQAVHARSDSRGSDVGRRGDRSDSGHRSPRRTLDDQLERAVRDRERGADPGPRSEQYRREREREDTQRRRREQEQRDADRRRGERERDRRDAQRGKGRQTTLFDVKKARK